MRSRFFWRIIRKSDGVPAGKVLHNRTTPIRNSNLVWQRVLVFTPKG